MKKVLLIKTIRDLLTITACLHQNNKHKLHTVHWRYYQKTKVYTLISESKIHFLHWKHFVVNCFEEKIQKKKGNIEEKRQQKDKRNIVNGINCSNFEKNFFSESKWSLKLYSDEYKRSVKNRDYEKNENVKHYREKECSYRWNKKIVDRESRFHRLKILVIWKKTINSLKNPNHINKIFNMLPERWLPNLW